MIDELCDFIEQHILSRWTFNHNEHHETTCGESEHFAKKEKKKHATIDCFSDFSCLKHFSFLLLNMLHFDRMISENFRIFPIFDR